MKILGWRITRDTSLEADIELLFVDAEDSNARLLVLEKAFRNLSNDVRALTLKVNKL
jgi:hypothetical protein